MTHIQSHKGHTSSLSHELLHRPTAWCEEVCYRRASACLFSGVLGGQSLAVCYTRASACLGCFQVFWGQWPVNAFGLAEETPTLKTLFFLCCTPTMILMIYLSLFQEPVLTNSLFLNDWSWIAQWHFPSIYVCITMIKRFHSNQYNYG